jgi:hypothetical protein
MVNILDIQATKEGGVKNEKSTLRTLLRSSRICWLQKAGSPGSSGSDPGSGPDLNGHDGSDSDSHADQHRNCNKVIILTSLQEKEAGTLVPAFFFYRYLVQ